VFESKERLAEDIAGLLGACAGATGGRYACVLDPKGVLFEHGSEEGWVFKQYLSLRAARLFEIPAAMAAGAPLDDAFADWESRAGEPADEFLLAFLNGKVAVVLACPDAASAEHQVTRPLRALADRLFRFNPAWRLDEKGRGIFLSRPRLDLVVVGKPGGEG